MRLKWFSFYFLWKRTNFGTVFRKRIRTTCYFNKSEQFRSSIGTYWSDSLYSNVRLLGNYWKIWRGGSFGSALWKYIRKANVYCFLALLKLWDGNGEIWPCCVHTGLGINILCGILMDVLLLRRQSFFWRSDPGIKLMQWWGILGSHRHFPSQKKLYSMVTSNIVIPCMFASHRRYNALLPVIHGDGCIQSSSSCLCVGCPYSPRSLTGVSSRGFGRLPPSRNSNYLGYGTDKTKRSWTYLPSHSVEFAQKCVRMSHLRPSAWKWSWTYILRRPI